MKNIEKRKLFAYKLFTPNYAGEDTPKSAGNRIYFTSCNVLIAVYSTSCFKPAR